MLCEVSRSDSFPLSAAFNVCIAKISQSTCGAFWTLSINTLALKKKIKSWISWLWIIIIGSNYMALRKKLEMYLWGLFKEITFRLPSNRFYILIFSYRAWWYAYVYNACRDHHQKELQKFLQQSFCYDIVSLKSGHIALNHGS